MPRSLGARGTLALPWEAGGLCCWVSMGQSSAWVRRGYPDSCCALGSLGFLRAKKPFLVSDVQWASPLVRSQQGCCDGWWVCRDAEQSPRAEQGSGDLPKGTAHPLELADLMFRGSKGGIPYHHQPCGDSSISFSEKINHPAPGSPAR